jgi:glycyl-tRNA synthetase beta chain
MPRKGPPPRRTARPGVSSGGTARLVFELGTEEMPPGAAWDGARQLREAAPAAFAAARISVRDVRAYSTPRRLVLIADGVAPRQADLVREIRGPAARAAFAPDGRPTDAALGFARAQGVPVTALERRTVPQGEYVYALRREPGASTERVLTDLLPSLAGTLVFPRAMRWGTGKVRFARPVRWVLALLGSRVLPCEFAGLRADRRTMGHRVLHPQAIRVPTAEAFEEALRGAFVLLDPDARRRRITEEVTQAASQAGGRPILDPDLLEESVQLVEWPTAFAGRFAPEFLALPREVLITVMQHHQKYFAVEETGGRLLPGFVAVRNGGTRGLETVREGNEWVLRARLADARFFFEEDRKRPLASHLADLQGLVVHERLGTMAEKVQRLETLARQFAEILRLDPQTAGALVRAAHLCKADLVTHVVREFPELQGVMGGIYARLDGEPEPVAEAIREQYLPRGSVLPRSDVGAYLALADKLDALLGALAAGLAPTGSQDPYGLRRAAQGIVAIILDRGVSVDVRDLARAALDAWWIHEATRREAALESALDLLRQRLRGTLIEEGISYDTVDAVLASGADNFTDAAARARALAAFRRRPEFARVYTAFDRALRILPPEFDGQVQPPGLVHPAERALLAALETARPEVRAAAQAGRYGEALEALSRLADPVDRFFTDVLVMAEEEAVRTNRLALLGGVVRLIRPIADLSRVVVGEGKASARS